LAHRDDGGRARQLAEGLAPLKKHPLVKDIRQIGLMAGIELIGDRMGHKACDAAIQRGVWLRPLGNVVVLMPPLAINEKELDFLAKTVREAIESTEEQIAKSAKDKTIRSPKDVFWALSI